VSGQIPADEHGNLIEGSIATKTESCCKNIIAILDEAGSALDRVVKVIGLFFFISLIYPFSFSLCGLFCSIFGWFGFGFGMRVDFLLLTRIHARALS